VIESTEEPSYLTKAEVPKLEIDWKDMVKIPNGIGKDEWIATHSK
jgi:hypothetical protein